jgi:hypothetical protein
VTLGVSTRVNNYEVHPGLDFLAPCLSANGLGSAHGGVGIAWTWHMMAFVLESRCAALAA